MTSEPRLPDPAAPAASAPSLQRPVAAALAVVIRADHVLLVRRANPPDIDRWGFPGGKIDPGEAIETAAIRELLEETGIRATPVGPFTAVDAFDHAEDGRLRFHYVLVAVLCSFVSGKPSAGDDALEARWIPLQALEQGDSELALSLDVAAVARQAAGLAR